MLIAVTQYHPSCSVFQDSIRANWDILGRSTMTHYLYEHKLITAYKRPKNLGEFLIRARYLSPKAKIHHAQICTGYVLPKLATTALSWTLLVVSNLLLRTEVTLAGKTLAARVITLSTAFVVRPAVCSTWGKQNKESCVDFINISIVMKDLALWNIKPPWPDISIHRVTLV